MDMSCPAAPGKVNIPLLGCCCIILRRIEKPSQNNVGGRGVQNQLHHWKDEALPDGTCCLHSLMLQQTIQIRFHFTLSSQQSVYSLYLPLKMHASWNLDRINYKFYIYHCYDNILTIIMYFHQGLTVYLDMIEEIWFFQIFFQGHLQVVKCHYATSW